MRDVVKKYLIGIFLVIGLIFSASFGIQRAKAASVDTGTLLGLNSFLGQLQIDGDQKCAKHEDRGGKRYCQCTVKVFDTSYKDADPTHNKATYNIKLCYHSSLYPKFQPQENGEKLYFNGGGAFSFSDLYVGFRTQFDGNYEIGTVGSKSQCYALLGDDLVKSYGLEVQGDAAVDVGGTNRNAVSCQMVTVTPPGPPNGCLCQAPSKPNIAIGFDGSIHFKSDADRASATEFTNINQVLADVIGIPRDPDQAKRVAASNQKAVNQFVSEQACPLTGAYRGASSFGTGLPTNPYDCSKPLYITQERCCCTKPQKGTNTTKYGDCKVVTGFDAGGGCPDQYQEVNPPGGKCDSSLVIGEVKADVGASGISASQLLAEAQGLNQLTKFSGPSQLIGQAIRLLLSFIGSIALILYIYAGILWMTAAGSSEQIEKAKQIFLWTSLGLVAMLGSYVVVRFLFGTVLNLQV